MHKGGKTPLQHLQRQPSEGAGTLVEPPAPDQAEQKLVPESPFLYIKAQAVSCLFIEGTLGTF